MNIDYKFIERIQELSPSYIGLAKNCTLPSGVFRDIPITPFFTERDKAIAAVKAVENLPEGATGTGIGV